MPRRAILGIERRDDLRLSPELGVPSAGQKVRTAFSEREIPRRFENLVFPVYAGPLSPRGASELSASPEGFARRQSRTGHGRNGRKGNPFPSSGLSAASIHASLNEVQPNRAVAMYDHSGSHRAVNPGRAP